MTTLALLSDIHGNLPALEAVLDDLSSRGIDHRYHLGDLVGYGPWPEEVIDRIRKEGIAGIAGNYDSTVATGHDHCGCRYDDPRQAELSHASYGWTRERVREETARWLRSLPFRLDLRPGGGHASGPTLVLVHGTPTLNTVYWHKERKESFSRTMAGRAGARAGDAVAFGHTHRPWSRYVEGVRLVNAGSVGRPKDGDPRACYARVVLSETNEGGGPWEVEFVRVEYDVERAADGITRSGLPDDLATILRTGGEL